MNPLCATGGIPPQGPGGLRAAFACNNAYHLAVAMSTVRHVPGNWDLYLFGRSPTLAGMAAAKLPIWHRRTEWFYDGSLRTLLAIPANRISSALHSLRGQKYEYIFYFVDKEPTNQLFLRTHPESQKVLIQEGIGLYDDTRLTFKVQIKKKLIWSLKFHTPLRCRGAEQGVNQYHHHIVARWPEALPSCKVGRATAHGYRQAVPAQDFERIPNAASSLSKKRQQNTVLFVGSGIKITSHGWMSLDEEAEIIRQLVDVAVSCGRLFCVKPHPGEPHGKYEQIDPRIRVIYEGLPVEALCLRQRPRIVLSFMSSALLNLCYQPRLVYLYELIGRDFPNKAVLRNIRRASCDFEAPTSMAEAATAIRTAGDMPRAGTGQEVTESGPFVRDVISRIVGHA